MTDNDPVKQCSPDDRNRITAMALLTNVLRATEKLARGETIDTADVEALAEAYNRVGDWKGSGAAYPRDIFAERMRMASEYQMEDEMI